LLYDALEINWRLKKMTKEQRFDNPSAQLFSGDKVTYPECFGDKVLVFVGMAEQLDFSNDCVVTHGGNACPARRSGLVKLAI